MRSRPGRVRRALARTRAGFGTVRWPRRQCVLRRDVPGAHRGTRERDAPASLPNVHLRSGVPSGPEDDRSANWFNSSARDATCQYNVGEATPSSAASPRMLNASMLSIEQLHRRCDDKLAREIPFGCHGSTAFSSGARFVPLSPLENAGRCQTQSRAPRMRGSGHRHHVRDRPAPDPASRRYRLRRKGLGQGCAPVHVNSPSGQVRQTLLPTRTGLPVPLGHGGRGARCRSARPANRGTDNDIVGHSSGGVLALECLVRDPVSLVSLRCGVRGPDRPRPATRWGVPRHRTADVQRRPPGPRDDNLLP